MYKAISRHLKPFFFCFAVALLLSLVTATAQASTAAAPVTQSGDCRIAVQPGWSPHRAQPEDTLASLAARSGVTVEDLMQANCLEGEEIEAGALILTPKLGPPVPTATPTTPPTATAVAQPTATETTMPTTMPTEAPTKALIVVVEESTVTPVAAEEAASTPMATATQQEVADTSDIDEEEPTPTATVEATATAEEDAAPIVVGTNNTTPPTSPIGTNGLITLSLLIMGAVSALFFALQPRPKKGPTVLASEHTVQQPERGNFGMAGNFAFLIGGFVVGVVVFPMLQMPSFTTIPTWLSAGAAVALIALLALKEIFLGAMEWSGLNRALNLGIAPLLMIFLLSVASKFAGMVQ